MCHVIYISVVNIFARWLILFFFCGRHTGSVWDAIFFRKILNKFPFLRFVSSLIYLSNGDEIALISVLSKFNDKK